jgi:hypothetical protein
MERVECVGKQMVRNQDRKNKFHEVMQEKNWFKYEFTLEEKDKIEVKSE